MYHYYLKYFKAGLFVAAAFLLTSRVNAQENFTFSGMEASNFDTIDLSVGNTLWTTERGSDPGYFSAINGAVYTNGTDASNVNGYVKKYGSQSFMFPVGSGSDLRMLTISAPAASTDVYAVSWITGDPGSNIDATAPYAGFHPVSSVSAPVASVSDAGQWDWQVGDAGNLGAGSTGTGAGLTISVSIPDMSSFASTSSLRLVGWNGTEWVDLSGAPTATGNTENSILSGTMIPGITAIAIGSVSVPLAVELVSFHYTAKNCSVDLQWRIVNGSNIEKFIAEKSMNGTDFEMLSEVASSGSDNDTIYHFTNLQYEQEAYYRLRIVNKDGSFSYTRVLSCQTQCLTVDEVILYPNPVSNGQNINLSITTNYKGTLKLMITNVSGQQMKQLREKIYGGKVIIPVNISDLAHGAYFLSILTNEDVPLNKALKFTILN